MDLWRIGKAHRWGGEGRAPIIRKRPAAFGVILKGKVEKKNKYSDNLIRHRIKLLRSLFVLFFSFWNIGL